MAIRPAAPADGIAWVTGASSGIGRAVALTLARDGFRVAASARGAEALAELAAEAASAGLSVEPFPLDVTDPTAAAAVVARIEAEAGPIALAVLNAGIYLPVSGDTLDPEAFRTSFRVNLEGTVNTLAPVLARMRERGQGQIAIVSSVAGYRGLPTSAAYGATKAGLINMAESLKFDCDRMGVKLQVVNPGFVDTPATRRNEFPMPALMPVDTAAERLVLGLASASFEITFPRRFTWWLKLGRILPYRAYFALASRIMGTRN
ncbi:SDR family NAD(P)-dependent oxidoreductase [Prosthecomicrobium sp. N25]|uniref:SDR family NAD(P)-dependent oxidoreductase n=1 Tax=Prosthecomicrobium sp. N25 TaxID=3129254 RepID=UPI003078248A